MAINLMDLLQDQMTDGFIDQLSNQIGGADKEQTAAAATGIMSTLMGALAKNASSQEGASSLANALDRDHDGSILDDLMGMLSGGGAQAQSNPTLNGTGILNHVLGPRQNGAVNMISQVSGLDSGKTGQLMAILAPVVLGALGKAKKQQGLDAGGLANLLSGTVTQQRQQAQNPAMNLIATFLDSDRDGDIKDDVARIGLNMLKGLFSKKR